MPVTEFAILRLKEPFTIENEALRANFQSVAERQAEWSGYPLTFYYNFQDPSLFYVVSGWEDSEAHRKWIASDTNQQFLHIFGPILTVDGLAHIDIDFNQIPSNTSELLVRKETGGGEGTGFVQESDDGRQPSWRGHGVDVDNTNDFYYLEAYDDFKEPVMSKAGEGTHVLKRVYA